MTLSRCRCGLPLDATNRCDHCDRRPPNNHDSRKCRYCKALYASTDPKGVS